MRNLPSLILVAALAALALPAQAANWPAAQPPALAHASGYVVIPNVAVPRDPARTYKAIFDATEGSADHNKVLKVFDRVGLQINGLKLAKVPADHIRFAMVFHGPAVEALYTDAHYRQKFGVANPNLPLIAELVKAGVEIFVCGQYMAGTDTPASALIADARVGESATLVLITYGNDGYTVIQ